MTSVDDADTALECASPFLGCEPSSRTVPEAVVIGMCLSIIVLSTIVGNLFVIFAVAVEKDLRRPQYLLIVSLAVADLLVGCVVTPVSTVYELQKRWTLGIYMCEIWTSMDVLVCTASILHLVAIAIDRYWSVTDITYIQRRTPLRMGVMLGCVWVASLLLAILPVFGWKDNQFDDRVMNDKICLLSQDVKYQLFSTMTAFYLPLFAIIFIYWRVFKAAKRRFKRERDRKAPAMSNDPRTTTVIEDKSTQNARLLKPTNAVATTDVDSDGVSATVHNGAAITREATTSSGDMDTTKASAKASVATESQGGATPKRSVEVTSSGKLRNRLMKTKKETEESKRERKAWRVLAIITGTFVMCWLPFFLLAVARPLLGLEIPRPVEGFVNWLGYVNSAVNPILYTTFSPDFRMAFHKMLKRLMLWK